MLDYRICEKLKGAGFPQEPSIELPNSLEENKGSFYYTFPTEGGCGGTVFLNQIEYPDYLKKEGWTLLKVPQLEELIKAILAFEWPRNGWRFNLEGHWMHDFGYEAKIYILESIEPPQEKTFKEWALNPNTAIAMLFLELNHQVQLLFGDGFIGAKWCSEHKVYHQDFCPECKNEKVVNKN